MIVEHTPTCWYSLDRVNNRSGDRNELFYLANSANLQVWPWSEALSRLGIIQIRHGQAYLPCDDELRPLVLVEVGCDDVDVGE